MFIFRFDLDGVISDAVFTTNKSLGQCAGDEDEAEALWQGRAVTRWSFSAFQTNHEGFQNQSEAYTLLCCLLVQETTDSLSGNKNIKKYVSCFMLMFYAYV